MASFEDVQKLAQQKGVGVTELEGWPGWCLLDMPSRVAPNRKMPPLKFLHAEDILLGRIRVPKY